MRYFVLFSLAVTSLIGWSQKPLTDWVNPFIGTGGHGHTYPGATMPFGMVQLSPDTRLTGWDGCSGYHYSDSIIYGFSHTHLQGTGVSDYGDILFMPTNGKTKNTIKWNEAYASAFSHKNESAAPGYYQVKLDNYNINVELTATERVGIHKYTLSPNDTLRLFIDMAHRDELISYDFKTYGDTVIYGHRISKAWATEQHCYFYAVFSKPFQNLEQLLEQSEVENEFGEKSVILEEKQLFSILFSPSKNNELIVKVGISGTDSWGAQHNLWTEAPHWDFNKYKQSAQQKWEQQMLKLPITSNDKDHLTNYYTALYHACTTPNIWSDVDGRYRGIDKGIHEGGKRTQYTVFSLWDTFRALHPLMTIIEKERTGDFIQSMLDMYEQTFSLPVWELAANETNCMIGYHAVSVITDAYAKGIRNFNTTTALNAMMATSLNSQEKGEYYEKGFVPSENYSESVSKTLEYAYNDWCIAQFGRMVGNDGIYEEYMTRAQNWKNVFDPKTKFMRPRRNGGFPEPFDPFQVDFNFTEANAWQYRFFIPHDIETFISWAGGKEKVLTYLDEMFTASSKTTGREQADITGLIGQYAHGNEPSHHVAFLYNYVLPTDEKTIDLVKRIQKELYKPTPDGLCGNEDCGQMSAWYVLTSHNVYSTLPGIAEFQSFGTVSPEMIAKGIKYSRAPKSRITYDDIVSVPIVSGPSTSFIDSTLITISHPDPYTVISGYFYNEKNDVTEISTRQFYIKESGKLVVKATSGDYSSKEVTALYYKRNNNRKLNLSSKFDNQYTGGGQEALIDGVKGGLDFKTGTWQGYRGNNLIATVDLGKKENLNYLALSCLRDTKSWIWYPVRTEFYISDDGKNWKSLNIYEELELTNETVDHKEIGGAVQASGRYVKVVAYPLIEIPEWHLGAGESGWIFADEFIIK